MDCLHLDLRNMQNLLSGIIKLLEKANKMLKGTYFTV